MKAYIDTDVLVWHLRGEKRAFELLKSLRDQEGYELWTGAVQRAEVVFFMRPSEEANTMLFLSQIRTAPIDGKIVDTAGELYRRWNPRYDMDVNDALLAAEVLENGGMIYTLNAKHYPMPEIVVKRAWDS